MVSQDRVPGRDVDAIAFPGLGRGFGQALNDTVANKRERQIANTDLADYGHLRSFLVTRYGSDTAHLKEYSAAAKEEGGWDAYVGKFVEIDPADYLEKVGGADKISAIPAPVF